MIRLELTRKLTLLNLLIDTNLILTFKIYVRKKFAEFAGRTSIVQHLVYFSRHISAFIRRYVYIRLWIYIVVKCHLRQFGTNRMRDPRSFPTWNQKQKMKKRIIYKF